MICAWEPLQAVLPIWLRQETNTPDLRGMQELRLRLDMPPEIILGQKCIRPARAVCREDLQFVINAASRYSPWAAATAAQGYLTIKGGHRIGICGEVVRKQECITGFREVRSLCIRTAHDVTGIAKGIDTSGSVLILGAPGWGKTTLLRDLIRRISSTQTVSVVDTREELFPQGFLPGRRMDVLTGCPKPEGIDMVLRTMGPEWIAVDEITGEEDCAALIRAVGCGVKLLATAHAASIQDLTKRPIYRKLLESKLFDKFLVLRKDKTFREERVG